MEASTSAQIVPNSGPDNTKTRGGSGNSRGKPRRGKWRPRGTRPEPKKTADNVEEAGKPGKAASSPPNPSTTVVDGGKAPTQASATVAAVKSAPKANADPALEASSSKPNAEEGKKQEQRQKGSSPPRSKRGKGRGAGHRSNNAKRPTAPTDPVQPEGTAKGVETREQPPSTVEQPAAAVAAATKPERVRPRLQADVKQLLHKRVQEAMVGLESVKGAKENLKIEKKQEEKLQEEVKNEQDEEVEDEVDDGLGETTGDEEEEKKDAKEPVKDGAKSRKKPRKKKATKAEKEAKQEAHFQLVMEAARTVVRILKDRGIECAVFGSLAARLYGSYRCPKDVDMLVLQDPSIPPEQQLTAEQLKVLFLDTSPLHFYLKLPRNPEDTYRILYYRREYLGVDCKVDILIPGTMYLPHTLPPNDEQTATRWVDGIPLVPFGLLLLHKLQGWDDHRLAEEEFRQKKQIQDAADVKKILGMNGEVNKLVKTVSTTNENRWWKDPILFSEEFRDLTKRRVEDYCKEFQDRSKAWKKLGFDVPDSAPQPSKSNSKPSKPESTVEAPAPPETQPHQEAEVGQVLSPPAPHQLDLQPHPEPESAQSATGIGRTRSVSIPMPPLPRVKEVLDGIVTEGTLFTPDLDAPVSPDEIVCRVGGLTGAPEIVPVVSGGGLSAIPATVPVASNREGELSVFTGCDTVMSNEAKNVTRDKELSMQVNAHRELDGVTTGLPAGSSLTNQAAATAVHPSRHQVHNAGEVFSSNALTSAGGEKDCIARSLGKTGEADSSQLPSTARPPVSPLAAVPGSGNGAQSAARCPAMDTEAEIPLPLPAIILQGSQNVINGGTFTTVGRDIVYNIQTLEEHNQKLKKMLKWLSPINFRSAYEENLAKWTPGTASRFLKSDAFQRWLHGKDIVLCGTGMPGAGKTVLSSLVISTITKPHDTLVAFVYCRYTEPLSIRDILAALARQIMEDHQHLSALLEPLFDHRSLRDMQPTQGELLALLQDVGKTFPAAHYILDGLDEAQPDIQYGLVEVLASLGGNLLLTSRPLPLLKKVVPHIIFVDVVAEQGDIASLVAQQIAKCPAFDDLLTRTGSKGSVISKVEEHSQGMFLHAALQVEMVRRCTTLKSVMKQLDSMPSKLEEMYALTIERIEKQSEDPELTDLAKRALLWVIYSEEPLTLQELQLAVACTPDNESFDATALVSEDVLLSSCAGLLSVEGKRNTVRLIHYTAKVALATILAQTYSEPHSVLSQGCILYLRTHGINDTPAEALFHASGDMPFVSYSLRHWVSHARKCSAFSSPTDARAFLLSCRSFPLGWYPWISRHLPTMAPSPFHVATFYNILHLMGGAFQVDEDGVIHTPSGTTNANTWPRRSTSPLTFSVSRGHFEAVDWLLAVPNLQVNYCSANGNTSLHLACIRGAEWTGIAERLLRHEDIDVNSANAQGRTPLMASLQSGNLSEPLVHALLQRPEIDLNRSDNEGATALLLAVKSGRPWILSSILANPDVDVNQATLFGWTPLMEAVEWGHDAAAHALLDHPSIHANLKTDDNETVLMIASYQCNESILKRLITLPDIDVNARRCEDGHTALTLARSEDVMLLLLDAPGIAVNSKSKRGMSAMAIAALEGWERAMARLLSFPEIDIALLPALATTEPLMLEYLDMPGIDINACDIYGWNAIVLASRQGWHRAVKRILAFTELDGDAVNTALVMSSTEEVIVCLLDFPEVKVTAKRRDGETPLMLASEAGWPKAVQRLLEHPDAGVNIVNDMGETPLMLARSEETLVNLLQVNGLDVNKRTATGETVLMMAAEIGWETAVGVMINYPGIELNARDDDGVTALMNAVGEGWDGIVQLFLEDGRVDVNVKDATGRTALMIACDLGYESIVKLLTNHPGADVNARDNTGRTALMTAASEDHKSIVHHLMETPQILGPGGGVGIAGKVQGDP